MNAFFLAWTVKGRHPVVFNGTAWVDSPSENTHRERAKMYSMADAREKLNPLRVRFGGVEQITIVPVATVRDVASLADALPEKKKRGRR